MPDLPLDIRDHLTSIWIGLAPTSVKFLGGEAELDDEIGGEILRLNLATFFPP